MCQQIGALQVPWNSMEFQGTAHVIEKLAYFEFHGIPWNCLRHRNWRTQSSMEFHGTSRVSEIGTLQVLWNSTEFHGTVHVNEIGALQVPWNSMEFHVTARVIEICALQVPWNSMEFHRTACNHNMKTLKFEVIAWNSMLFSVMHFREISLNNIISL